MKAFIRAQTRARQRKFTAQLRSAARATDDPDAIHDLRVAIRRYSQCLRAFAPVFERSEVRKIRKRLKKLMDRCAAVRNCDIALDVLRDAGARTAKITAEIELKRGQAERKLSAALRRWRKKDIASRFCNAPRIISVVNGPWNLEKPVEENARRVLPALAASLFQHGDQAARTGATPAELHEFRLDLKHFRYTLEIFETVYGGRLGSHMEKLRETQDHLGAISDCMTTLGLIQGHHRAEARVHRLLLQREANFREFWKQRFGARTRARWLAVLSRKSKVRLISKPQTAPAPAT
jgi:CHAD domain-containing protein